MFVCLFFGNERTIRTAKTNNKGKTKEKKENSVEERRAIVVFTTWSFFVFFSFFFVLVLNPERENFFLASCYVRTCFVIGSLFNFFFQIKVKFCCTTYFVTNNSGEAEAEMLAFFFGTTRTRARERENNRKGEKKKRERDTTNEKSMVCFGVDC